MVGILLEGFSELDCLYLGKASLSSVCNSVMVLEYAPVRSVFGGCVE